MGTDNSELNVEKKVLKLPYALRSHKGFADVKITVDEDQIHFQVNDEASGLPELWIYDSERKGWANIVFITE